MFNSPPDDTPSLAEFASSPDVYNLKRFTDAQDRVYSRVLEELRAARKVSHWMWFVFPQLAGLGTSATAQHYALSGLTEAGTYLNHSALGPRLLECTSLVNAAPAGTPIEQIFGFPDYLKFCSCVTLFRIVSPGQPEFVCALERFFAGEPDRNTLDRLDPG